MAEKKKMRLRVITPQEIKLDEQVEMVIFRCTTGYMGILPGHEQRSAVLDFGVMRIIGGHEYERWLAVFGGLVEVKDDVVTVLANAAEWPQDIDVAHATSERERLKQILQEHDDDIELQRDQALLWRNLVRIEMGEYPHMGSLSEIEE